MESKKHLLGHEFTCFMNELKMTFGLPAEKGEAYMELMKSNYKTLKKFAVATAKQWKTLDAKRDAEAALRNAILLVYADFLDSKISNPTNDHLRVLALKKLSSELREICDNQALRIMKEVAPEHVVPILTDTSQSMTVGVPLWRRCRHTLLTHTKTRAEQSLLDSYFCLDKQEKLWLSVIKSFKAHDALLIKRMAREGQKNQVKPPPSQGTWPDIDRRQVGKSGRCANGRPSDSLAETHHRELLFTKELSSDEKRKYLDHLLESYGESVRRVVVSMAHEWGMLAPTKDAMQAMCDAFIVMHDTIDGFAPAEISFQRWYREEALGCLRRLRMTQLRCTLSSIGLEKILRNIDPLLLTNGPDADLETRLGTLLQFTEGPAEKRLLERFFIYGGRQNFWGAFLKAYGEGQEQDDKQLVQPKTSIDLQLSVR